MIITPGFIIFVGTCYFSLGILTMLVDTALIDKGPGVENIYFVILLWPFSILFLLERIFKKGFKWIFDKIKGIRNVKLDKLVNKDPLVIEMNNKQLTVLVCGHAGTGKTLLAKTIEESLSAAGFEVDRIIDDSEPCCWSSEDVSNQTKNLISEGLEITVRTIQINRTAYSNQLMESDEI
jgi:hypothetical protein